MMRNTTIPDIINEIQDEDDLIDEDEADDKDKRDWIRHMYKENLSNIVVAKLSNELSNEFKDSLMVVFLNTSATDPENTYSVMRYYRHYSGWIREKHAFDFIATDGVADFFLFDNYAMYLTADQEEFTGIWFQEERDDDEEWIASEQRTIKNDYNEKK